MLYDDKEAKSIISDVVKKQMVILGPDIAILKARNVTGLLLSDDGKVEEITGNASEVLKELINEYISLSGLIVRKTMEPLLQKYPDLILHAQNESMVGKGGE